MKIALVNFDIDKYLIKFAEKISQNFQVESFMGYRKPKANSTLRNSDFVDATLLYRVENFEDKFDQKLIIKNKDYYFKYFLLFSNVMDRVSPIPHSSNYKELYFWKLINFFVNYINKKKIDLFFFDCTPHRPWDFILFLVAKNLGKRTLILRRTEFIGKNLIIEDFERNELKFHYEYNNQVDHNFSDILDKKNLDHLKNYLRSKDNRDGLTLKRYEKTNNLEILSKRNNFYNVIFKLINFFKVIEIKYIFFDVLFKKIPLQQVGATEDTIPNTTVASLKKINKFDYFFIKLKCLLRNLKINRLNKNIKDFKMEEKYIFFPLPFQPERTTLPEAGNNGSIINSIKFLSANLPHNIIIVVKEHPRQLYKDIRTYNFRDENFYNELLKIKNVKLVNVREDYNKLISNCILTSTLCGSVIFDGLMLGKPSLVFGNTWLSDCESVKLVNLNEDLKTTFSELLNKKEDQVKDDLFNFLKNNQKFFINAACDGWEIERFKLDENKNLENLISAVKNRIGKV